MDRLVTILGSRIGVIAREYSGYRMALRDGDDYFVVRHGQAVIDHCNALGFSPHQMSTTLERNVQLAKARICGEAT